jgi:succinate dehydrogenase/fumarate reductase flavoprotein subunit
MLAHEKLGPIRDEMACRAALDEYREIEADQVPMMRLAPEARDNDKVLGQELESALSVKNLALLGRLLATSALAREESRGAHFRIDFPNPDDKKWRVVTRLEPDAGGAIVFHTDPVKQAPASAKATG